MSKRRLQSGIVFFLFVLAAFLVRPVRSWIDQAIVTHFLDPDLSVGELVLHTDASVVEFRNVRWSRQNSERVYGFTADRAWLAVDPVKLIDRRITIPQLELENAELYLEDHSPKEERVPSTWQQQFALRVVQLSWDDVQDNFGSLLSADSVHTTWTSRINQWVKQSENIVAQMRQAGGAEDLTDNPLRVEVQLKERIAKIDGLSAEQQNLANQFDTLQKLLDAECNRLRASFATELSTLESKTRPRPKGLSSKQIAQEIVKDLSENNWELYAVMAEISDAMARGVVIDKWNAGFDRDIPLNKGSDEELKVGNLTSQGFFVCGNSRAPFAMKMRFETSNISSPNAVDSEWEYVFELPRAHVATRVTNIDPQKGSAHIELVAARKTDATLTSPSDRGIDFDSLAHIQELEVYQSVVSLSVDASKTGIVGKLSIPLPMGPEMPEPWLSLRKNAVSQVSESEVVIDYDVEGSWQEPMFTVKNGTPPEWLAKSIQKEFDYDRSQSSSLVAKQATAKFDAKIQSLQQLVQNASSRGRMALEDHREELAGARNSLQASLDDLNGASFARRNTGTTNR